MRCSNCGNDNREGRKFCVQCGRALKAACPSCGAPAEPSEKFCGDCGAALVAEAQPASAQSLRALSDASSIRVPAEQASAVLGGERKTVTALFADIKGSTELERDLDPEEARAIVDPVLHLMMDAVHRYGGYVAQSTGDGIFALFGAPVSHEDHPQRALHAALAMQEELHRYAERLRGEGKPAVEARVGLNTGEVVVRTIETGGHAEYTPIGHVTNLAARMQTAAPSGSIAASEATQRLCEGYFEFRALGPTAIKGLDAPVEVYEVVRAGPLRTHFELAARRGLTRFVGRERELGELKRALELARSGLGQIVAVVAEAGTGKSRLFHEFKATLPKDCKLLEAYSVSHGKASAWLPVLELLRGYFGIEDTDDPETRREKVSGLLATLDPVLSDTLPYLLVLLGVQQTPDPLAQMDARIKKSRTLEAIKRILLRESLNQPLVAIFEDLHWIDSETQALLDLMADSAVAARLLLLVNYRPEYRHEWSSKGHYQQLRLDPLGGENTAVMLSALIGKSVELEPVKRMIAERTGGNPFFVEEIVQALFDEGLLVRDGVVKVGRPLSQLRLPPTVQGVLASRIDRLPPAHKDLLQMLAVIGRESPLALIRNVASLAEGEVERMLPELQAGEFIYERPTASDVEYVFKHALTQEVAYNSILIERRKLVHERTGHALETMFAGQLDDHLGQLAHHYSLSDNVAKAVEFLGRAGQQAMQRSAHADAIRALTAAIDLIQRLPDDLARTQRELLLLLSLGTALIATKGWAAAEVERAFARARELCKQLGDPPELFPVLFGTFQVHFLRTELRTARALAEQLLHRAQDINDQALLLLAHCAVGQASYQVGEFALARKHLETAISLYDRERHSMLAYRYGGLDAGVRCLTYASLTLAALGYSDRALNRGNEAVALAQALSQPHSLAFAENLLGYVHLFRGEAHAAQEAAERVLKLSVEQGFTLWVAFATGLRGAALAAQGRNEEGIAQMRESVAATAATKTEMARANTLTNIARAYMGTGRFDDALDAVAEAIAIANKHEDHQSDAEKFRVKGELLLSQDHSDLPEAQRCLQHAIEIARNQDAKSLELRATTSLARLLAKQGRGDEARAMLAEIYNWFTEGFDTADLKDAKALLDELGARPSAT